MNEIFTRRSVRQFKDTPVQPEKIEALLKAGMQAPSAVNQQPWEFIVVQDKELILKLEKFSPFAKMLKTAPLAIVVLERKDVRASVFAAQDLGACTQNILLEGVTQGLGCCWLGVDYDSKREKFITDMFALPSNIRPFAVIAVGYPEKQDANTFINRFEQDRIHYNKF